MSALRDRPRAERWLVAALFALWIVSFVAAVRTVVQHIGVPPVFVHRGAADDHPIVTGFRPYFPGDRSALRPGDRLLRVGEADLTGAGSLVFYAAFVEQVGGAPDVEVAFERDGVRETARVQAGSVGAIAPLLPAAVVFAGVAALLWLRASPSPMARAFIFYFLDMAFFLAANFFGSRHATYAAMAVHTATMTLVGPLGLRAMLLFPDGGRLRPADRVWPWAFAILGPLHTAHFGWPVPPAVGVPAAAAIVVAMLVVTVVIVTRAYRRADPIGRRRVKWLVFGVYWAALPPIVTGTLEAIDPVFGTVYFVSLAAVACIPLALLVSILHFDLFDIDRLLSSTASSNLLLAAGVVLAGTVVPRTAAAAAELLGVDSKVGEIGLIVPIALGVVAAHRRLRPRLDRFFFAERYAIDTGIQRLLTELSACADAETLARRTGEELTRVIRPETCTVYVRTSGGYEPLFVAGRGFAPTLPGDGPLVATLRERRSPLALDGRGRHAADALDPFERAVLDMLGAAVVVPVRRGTELFLLVCLGPKRSGDVYTPTDVRLLVIVGDKIAGELARIDQAGVIRHSRHVQEALGRYVPTAIAEALGAGRELEPEEREVTVLFVDMRSYTALCEPLEPRQIFAAVDRYTQTVSQVIQEHGGTVVEFGGDGMMAVFGAPESSPRPEAAAVRAAREIALALTELEPVAGAGPVAVGIGIATGPAFVGNVRSADRLFWTALGSTTNFAARLQGLTRDLDVLAAIDETTHARAGIAATNFRRRADVTIRGQRQPATIYVLPLVEATAAA